MADLFRPIADPSIEVALAFAVKPVDAITGRPLRDEVTVSIADVHADPLVNPSGYWLFLTPPVELPDDPVTLTIETSPRYIDRTTEVFVDDLEPPALRVQLYPSTAYDFPRGRTLVLGTVVDDDGEPVSDATAGIRHTDLETRTDTDGSFVLAVDGIVSTEFAENGDALRVDPDSDDPTLVRDHGGDEVRDRLTLVVDHPGHDETTTEREIHEGELTVLDAPIVM